MDVFRSDLLPEMILLHFALMKDARDLHSVETYLRVILRPILIKTPKKTDGLKPNCLFFLKGQSPGTLTIMLFNNQLKQHYG